MSHVNLCGENVPPYSGLGTISLWSDCQGEGGGMCKVMAQSSVGQKVGSLYLHGFRVWLKPSHGARWTLSVGGA